MSATSDCSFSLSLPPGALCAYVTRQVQNNFPDGGALDLTISDVETALGRIQTCFTQIRLKYYNESGNASFSHLHSDHYCSFLYLLANSIWKRGGDPNTCSKLFLLNKLYSGIDLYFEVALPEVFMLVHPVGTVLGRATYGNHLVVYQNCTVGGNHGKYPEIGDYCCLFSGSSVLGAAQLGNDCKVSARSLVLDTVVPAGSIYIGNSVSHIIKPAASRYPAWQEVIVGS